MRIKLSSLIFGTLLISLILRLLLSNWVLNYFYPYTLPGGTWYQKIHPATLLISFVLFLVVLLQGPLKFITDQRRYNHDVFIFFWVLVFVVLVSIIRSGRDGTAYLADTFLVGIMYVMLAIYLSNKQKYKIATIVIFIVCINAVIAIAEYFIGYSLIQPSGMVSESFFRATALFGHPLANGLITAVVSMTIFKMNWMAWTKAAVMILLLLSLVAFGARGALGILLLGIICYHVLVPFLTKATFKKKIGITLISCLSICVLLGFITFVIFQTKMGESISSRLSMDKSIEARINSIVLPSYFSYNDIILGQSQDDLNYIVAQNPGIKVIENFWVVLLLRLGMIIFIVFTTSWLYMLYRQSKRGNWIDAIIVAVFLLTASTNNSLSSKNAAFSIFILLLFCLQNKSSNVKRQHWQKYISQYYSV